MKSISGANPLQFYGSNQATDYCQPFSQLMLPVLSTLTASQAQKLPFHGFRSSHTPPFSIHRPPDIPYNGQDPLILNHSRPNNTTSIHKTNMLLRPLRHHPVRLLRIVRIQIRITVLIHRLTHRPLTPHPLLTHRLLPHSPIRTRSPPSLQQASLRVLNTTLSSVRYSKRFTSLLHHT